MESIKSFPLKRVWRRNLNKQLLEVDGYQPSEMTLKFEKTDVRLAKLSNKQKNLNSSNLSNFLQYLVGIISKNKELSGVAQVVSPVSLSYKIRRKSKRRYRDNSYAFLGIKSHKLSFKHKIYPKFSKKNFSSNSIKAKILADVPNLADTITSVMGVVHRPLKSIYLPQKRAKLPTRKIRHTLQRVSLLWNNQFSRIPRRKARKKPK